MIDNAKNKQKQNKTQNVATYSKFHLLTLRSTLFYASLTYILPFKPASKKRPCNKVTDFWNPRSCNQGVGQVFQNNADKVEVTRLVEASSVLELGKLSH